MQRRLLSIVLAGTLFSIGINAQEPSRDSLLHRDFSFISNADPWLLSRNAAALSRFKTQNVSMAELYVQYGKGGFVNYDASPRVLQAGAEVASFYRLTDKIVMSGSMKYDNFSGHDMSGSAFAQTSRLPFDIVEDSLTHAGTKHRDTYQLVGALSWDFYKGLSLGAKFDFTAANIAKYKDLRHKTKLMDMTVSAGVYVPLHAVSIGLNYAYRRNTQSLAFSTYATSAQDYVSYINYGPWIGTLEQFGNTGFTDNSREQPLLSEYHGIGIQAGWDILPSLSWFNDMDYSYRKGYYGRKSPYTIVYANHHSHLFNYHSRLSLKLSRRVHNLDFSFSSENLVNDMTAYRMNRNTQGASYYEYLNPVKSVNKAWNEVHIGYTGYYRIVRELPLWTVQTGLNFSQRKQTGYLYPYLRRQDLRTTEPYVSLSRNVIMRKGVFTLQAGYAYKTGSGDAFEDETMAKPSDKQKGFPVMEAFMYREYKYLTAPQYALNMGVKYAFVLPSTRMKTYIALDFSHCHACDDNVFLVGKNHTVGRLTVGCTF